jgi:hypothetical protein
LIIACSACGQRKALTTGQQQHQLGHEDVREMASAEGKSETMLPTPHINGG